MSTLHDQLDGPTPDADADQTGSTPAVATRVSNATRAVDFDHGADPDEIRRRQPLKRRNVHVTRLHEIVEAINADEAKIGEVYLIATFLSPHGAANVKRTISRDPHHEHWPQLLDQFVIELISKVTDDGSELWGGVMQVAS